MKNLEGNTFVAIVAAGKTREECDAALASATARLKDDTFKYSCVVSPVTMLDHDDDVWKCVSVDRGAVMRAFVAAIGARQ